MPKIDIAMEIAKQTGLPIGVSKQCVQMTLDGIAKTLIADGRIELRNFGVLEITTRAPRKARNPKTGEEVLVPERKKVRFKPGKALLDQVRSSGIRRDHPVDPDA